ncbi:MAG: hypothetical protein OEM52_14450 [bacterium]|nr:hypothetical protein [bacterium]
MPRLFLLSISILILSLSIIGCTDDSSDPTSPAGSNYDLVGNWRLSVWATQQTGISGYSVSVFDSDSAYMSIDSSGHFVMEMRTSNVVTMRMVGRGQYNPPQIISIIDSIMQITPGPDTIHAGDTLVQTVTLSNNNGVAIFQSRSGTTNLINYGAYLRVGSDVKIAGVCGDYNENATTEWVGVPNVTVRCLNSAETPLQTTTTNAWGFFVFTGLTPQTLRPSGWIEINGVGTAYDNNPLPITTSGGYAVLLMR